MPSRPYGILKKNIADLQRQFLNFDKRQDGKYSHHELTQCRAFITFCHSEVEIYLETLSLRTVSNAEKILQSKGRVTNATAAMVSYRAKRESSLPEDPTNQTPKAQFSTIMHSAIAAQKAAIRNNNGIKRRNLAELFIPLGMQPIDFYEPLLIQLDKLGQRRGDHVHQSSKVSLPKIRDPFDDENNDIQFLLNDLQDFDSLASKLK